MTSVSHVAHIASLDDPRLTPFRSLKRTNETRWAKQFVAEGDKLVERLLESDYPLVSVLVSERFVDRWAGRVPEDRPLLVAEHCLIEKLVGFNFHHGVLACAQRKPSAPIGSITCTPGERAVYVICPDVEDPENLGSLLRLAAGFGVRAVLLGSDCCDPLSRRVLRVSMGTALRLPIITSPNLLHEVLRWKDGCGLELLATVLDETAEPLWEARCQGPVALVFGNEGHGLDREWIEACSRCLTIPMQNGVDSLNVAAAAGIFLYHFCGPTNPINTRSGGA